MPCSWSQYLSRASSHCGRTRGGQTPGHLAPPSCPSASLVAPHCEVERLPAPDAKREGQRTGGRGGSWACGLGKGAGGSTGGVRSRPRDMSRNGRRRGSGEVRAGRTDGRQVPVRERGWTRLGRRMKAADEQALMTDTAHGRTFTSGRTARRARSGEARAGADRRVRKSEAGGRTGSRGAETPTYSLPGTGVVAPRPAAALELALQPGQSLQLPLDGVSSREAAGH